MYMKLLVIEKQYQLVWFWNQTALVAILAKIYWLCGSVRVSSGDRTTE